MAVVYAASTADTVKEVVMSFEIFMDSGANIPAREVEKYKINVMSFVNLVDGKEVQCYTPGLTPLEERLEGRKFYDAMRAGAKVSTSMLNTHQFREYFEPVLKAGKDIIYIPISSGISGTYQAASGLAKELEKEYEGRRVFVVDSKNGSMGVGLHAITASVMRENGATAAEAAKQVESDVPKMNGLFTVGNLKYLSRTGRLHGAKAAVGNMLNVKPILRGDADGHIVEFRKTRGRRKSIEELCRLLIDNIVDPEDQIISIAHADAYEEALECAAIIKNHVNVKDIIITSYDFCTGSHVGPDTIAFFFKAKDRELSAEPSTDRLSVAVIG